MRSGALPPWSWVRSDEAVAVRRQPASSTSTPVSSVYFLAMTIQGLSAEPLALPKAKVKLSAALAGAAAVEPSSSPPPPQAASVSALSADTATSEPRRRNRRWLCWVIVSLS